MMAEVNVGLRVEIDKLRQVASAANFDIKGRVQRHTQTALVCAYMERNPPGYTPATWALHLMDLAPAKLHARLAARVEVEKDKIGEVSIELLMNHPVSVLPAIPADVPGELIPKMRLLDRKWTRDLFEREALKALSLLTPRTERDVRELRRATHVLQQVYVEVKKRVGVLHFKVKLHMTKAGAFEIRITETG